MKLAEFLKLTTILSINDIKARNSRNKLGLLWWFLDPLAMMAVFYFVVVVLFERGGENYHIFILSALMGWQTFSRSLSASANSLNSSKTLILQTNLPLSIWTVVPALVNGFFGIVGLLVLSLFTYEYIGWDLLLILPILVSQQIFAIGLGSYLAIATAKFPDTTKILTFVMRAWWFLSPVLYNEARVMESERIADWIKDIFVMNPMAAYLPAYRAIILDTDELHVERLLIWTAISLVMLFSGHYLLRRRKNKLAKSL